MQLAVAGWFGIQTAFTIAVGLLLYRGAPFVAVYAVIAIVWIVGGISSLQGRLMMFWIARTWFGFVGLSALINLRYLFGGPPPPFPLWVLIGTEAISAAGFGLFIWLVIGGRRYGPWAMKKAGT